MKLTIVLATLVAHALAYHAVREQPCRGDEVFDECGSLCHPTCENFDEPPMLCPAICVAGCYCADPLLRSVDGSCVSEAECPKE